MNRTQRFENEDVEAVIEVEREGSHPLGHRAVRQVLERTDVAQQEFDGKYGQEANS